MKLYIMTDLEGVAGVLDSHNWCQFDSRYYEAAKELLTLEVNAAVKGFVEGGFTEIIVVDGHGCGGIEPRLLDYHAQLMRGWKGYPMGLDSTWDAVAWVGRHAKAGTEYAHLAHTQSFQYLDLSLNGISIGEFGQFALCASEIGVRGIFASGDLAFTKEAAALVPGIETVSVKYGTTPGTGEECDPEQYRRRNTGAVHLAPERAREVIYEGALRAAKRFKCEEFGLISLPPAPYRIIIRMRAEGDTPARTLVAEHPTSIVTAMNAPRRPLE